MGIPTKDLKQKLADCREIYLKHNGREHLLIEREMRDLGYHDFHRRILYDRYERGQHHLGWVNRYGWQVLLRNAECGVRNQEEVRNADRGLRTEQINEDVSDPKMPRSSLRTSGSKNPHSAIRTPHSPIRTPHSDDFPDFQKWLKHVSPSMTWDWKHQVYIYKRLRRVTDGTCKRLMIFLPPRHGKSELVTVRYTAWRLKRDSKLNVIIGSYNQRLANRFSRKIRNVLTDDFLSTAESQRRGGEEGAGEDTRVGSKEHDRSARPNRSSSSPQRLRDSAVKPNPDTPPARAGGSDFRSRRINTEAEWETRDGGGVRAVGAGAGVTGYGAGLIVIDDPVKSRAEAESETFREKIWDWFNDDLYTRLEPGGAIILIQTRWHEDDLAGRLLRDIREEGAEHWDVINLPALAEGNFTAETQRRGEAENGLAGNAGALACTDAAAAFGRPADIPELHKSDARHAGGTGVADEGVRVPGDPLGREPGEALCAERYDEAALYRLKRRLGSYSFSALYQQRPVPAEGGLFKRKWFKVIDRLPPGIRSKKRGWDLGISGKDTADYTASLGVAYDRENNMYIYDGFRRRIEYPEQRRIILGRIRSEPDTEHGIELSANGTAAVQDLRRERNLRGRPVRGVKVKGDKISRALPWIALAEEGRVHLVRGPWINDFLDEAASFPTGTHDDQIDAVSVAVQMHRERSNRLFVF